MYVWFIYSNPNIKWGIGREIDEYVFSNWPYFLEGGHINVAIEIYMYITLQFPEYTHTHTYTYTSTHTHTIIQLS